MPRLGGAVSLGALGAVSAVLYAATLPAARWLGREPMAVHLVVFAALFAVYLVAVALVVRGAMPGRATVGVIIGFALVFRVMMLPTPVYLSSDVFRYLWDGRVQLAGINPYRYPPAALELLPLRDGEVHPRINRPSAPTVYPPGSQWLFALAATVTSGTVIGWRMLLLVVDGAVIALLLRVLRREGVPPATLVVYGWSPLVVIEGLQAGHVDLAVVPLVLGALLCRARGASLAAGGLLGLAVLVKLYPLVLVAAWWRRGDWKFPAAVATVVAVGYAPYVNALGAGALGFLPAYFDRAEDFNLGLRGLLGWALGVSGEMGRGILMGTLFAALAAALVRIGGWHAGGTMSAGRAAFLGAAAWLLLVPTSLHPWYALWLVPLLCLAPSPGWLHWSGAVTLSYVAYLVSPTPAWVWALEYLPLYALLLVSGWRSVRGRATLGAAAHAA